MVPWQIQDGLIFPSTQMEEKVLTGAFWVFLKLSTMVLLVWHALLLFEGTAPFKHFSFLLLLPFFMLFALVPGSINLFSGFSWLSQWSIDDSNADGPTHLARISVPVLVIGNSDDDGVPISHTKELYNAIKHSNKEFHIIQVADSLSFPFFSLLFLSFFLLFFFEKHSFRKSPK